MKCRRAVGARAARSHCTMTSAHCLIHIAVLVRCRISLVLVSSSVIARVYSPQLGRPLFPLIFPCCLMLFCALIRLYLGPLTVTCPICYSCILYQSLSLIDYSHLRPTVPSVAVDPQSTVQMSLKLCFCQLALYFLLYFYIRII